MRVIRATIADLDWMIPQLEAFSKFYGTKRPLFGDEAYIRGKLAQMFEHHVALVAEEYPVKCGFILGLMTPHFYNPTIRTLAEMFWWVNPAFRSGCAAVMLLDEFLRIGHEQADWITFGLAHNTPVKKSSLEKRGFKFVEHSFLKEV